MPEPTVAGGVSDVRRTLGTRTLEAGEAKVATISRAYPTTVDDLWDACTNPRRLPRWFLPVEGELAVGGKYQLAGNAGGTVERCDAPHSFAATWEYGGDVSWIEVTLTPEGDGARLTLEHVAHVNDDARWAQYGPGAVGVGWDLALSSGLARHIETGESVDPAAAEAWTGSPEGVAFISAASAGWAQAWIAEGWPAEDALAAAARTTAFYTGQPEPA
ncbi:SRPBCC family protein [Pseudonocardia sp. CA-107938]|uniref:SRPBCC family protein n=1 Tax=Pseudonocardia sp. CA-107938 TaxID=3240021 RepID=UPI003D8C6CB1